VPRSCSSFEGVVYHEGPGGNGVGVTPIERSEAAPIKHFSVNMFQSSHYFKVELQSALDRELFVRVDDLGDPAYDWTYMKGYMVCSESTNYFQEQFPLYVQVTPINDELQQDYARNLINHPYVAGTKGASYVRKLFAHEILPLHVERVIILDLDIFVQGDLQELWSVAGTLLRNNPDAFFAYVPEQQDVYQSVYGTCGVNGGLVVMDLERMRKPSNRYNRALERLTKLIGSDCHDAELRAMPMPYHCLWDLIDQTILANFESIRPDVYVRLPCEWNVQLSLYWYIKRPNSVDLTCKSIPKIIHANWPYEMKSALEQLHAQPHRFARDINRMILKEAFTSKGMVERCAAAAPAIRAELCNETHLIRSSFL